MHEYYRFYNYMALFPSHFMKQEEGKTHQEISFFCVVEQLKKKKLGRKKLTTKV